MHFVRFTRQGPGWEFFKGGLSPFENTTQGRLPTPCPLPLISFSKRGNLAATGGEDNSIHLISKGAAAPFGTPFAVSLS